jgi:hypothetical protein
MRFLLLGTCTTTNWDAVAANASEAFVGATSLLSTLLDLKRRYGRSLDPEMADDTPPNLAPDAAARAHSIPRGGCRDDYCPVA